jgi:hypothetical protein
MCAIVVKMLSCAVAWTIKETLKTVLMASLQPISRVGPLTSIVVSLCPPEFWSVPHLRGHDRKWVMTPIFHFKGQEIVPVLFPRCKVLLILNSFTSTADVTELESRDVATEVCPLAAASAK